MLFSNFMLKLKSAHVIKNTVPENDEFLLLFA